MSRASTTWWPLSDSRAAVRRLYEGLPALAPAFAVVVMLALLLLPLPTPLVDLLLSVSIGVAALLLVVSLRVQRPSEFLSFPVLLLVATLFRLALNVSTTRLILTQADAGKVVLAFSELVVRGDLIVGAVIFTVVTVVQFVVIARGTERVAEVAARFTLDAMPGQQASIEADLRSGAASPRQAAQRRAALDERARFFGAMDGALRLVKGDAIAGIVITCVNLIAGVAIGVTRNGIGVADSLDLYGRLTVGDGLVSQIPAMLLSLAAGILVARVERGGEGTLNQALGGAQADNWVPTWLDPSMLLVPATLLSVLAIVPGMPTMAFASIAVLALLIAFLAATATQERVRGVAADALVLEVPRSVVGSNAARARRELTAAAVGVSDELGLMLPRPRVEAIGGTTWTLRLEQRALATGELHGTARASLDQLVVELARTLVRQSHQFITLQQVENQLEHLRSDHPALVREFLARAGVRELTAVARGLVRERVPLPSWETLLSLAIDDPALDKSASFDVPRAIERIRRATVLSWLPSRLAGRSPEGDLAWPTLTPDANELALDLCRRSALGVELTASKASYERLLTPVLDALGEKGGVLVTSSEARPSVARVLERCAGFVLVVSREELAELHLHPAPRWIDSA